MDITHIQGKLKNGAQYIIANTGCGSSCTILVLFRVGSKNEGHGLKGVSHFIEHMMFKGTQNRPNPKDITSTIYQFGGKINAFTDYDNTGYFVKLDRDHIDLAMDILSDSLYNSLFRASDIEMEKGVVISENLKNDTNPQRLGSQLNQSQIFRGTPLQTSIGGLNSDIQKFNQTKVITYLANHYHPKNMVISVAGNLPSNIQKRIVHWFDKDIANVSVKIRVNAPKYKMDQIIKSDPPYINKLFENAEQNIGFIGFPSYSFGDPNSYAADILANILAGNMSSRLFVRLREQEGLVYVINEQMGEYDEIGSLKLWFGTFPDKKSVDRCCSIISDELKKIKKELIEEKELEEFKRFVIGRLLMGTENTEEVATFYGQHLLFLGSPMTYRDIVKAYEKVTAKDIMIVANHIFQKKKLNVTIVGPKKIANPFEKLSL